MTKIMLKMISLGFKGIDGFVVDFPTAPSGFDNSPDIFFSDFMVGNGVAILTEDLTVVIRFGIFAQVD